MRVSLERSKPSFVDILGHVPSIEREQRLARAHVLAATSVREGWGLNVSEAAACGTPAIGYRVPGLVDSVPASGGAVVDANPTALADALARVLWGELPSSRDRPRCRGPWSPTRSKRSSSDSSSSAPVQPERDLTRADVVVPARGSCDSAGS